MLNTILLITLNIFVGAYVIRSFIPETKKSFFKKKITSVTKQIWDYEFKVEKTLQIREGIRQDRDRLLDAKQKIEAALKATPDDKDKIAEFEKIVDTIKRYEAQMKMLDDQIAGGVPSEDNPAGQGINEIISSLAELRRMYSDYTNKI